YIRRHYTGVEEALKRLDEELVDFPVLETETSTLPSREVNKPTAAILVTGYNGLGLHSVLAIPSLFGNHFHNFVFISVGVIDSNRFKGAAELDNLRQSTEEMLQKYVRFCRQHGRYAEY